MRWRWHGRPEPGAATADSWERAYAQIRPRSRRRATVSVVVVDDSGSPGAVAVTLASVHRQTHAPVESIVVPPGGPVVGVLESVVADRVILVAAGDLLGRTAVEWCVSVGPGIDLIYGDHLVRSAGGSTPILKPAWSPRRQAMDGYVGTTVCLSASLAAHVASTQPSGLIEAVAQATRGANSVAHLPVPLWETEREAVTAPALPDLPEQPGVKVIVPTRDRADLLGSLMPGLLRGTSGVDLHVVIVDNGSVDPAALELLAGLSTHPDVTVVRVDEPFNFSRLVNVGARSGPSSEHLLLLNNDIEILDAGWLVGLCRWLQDPGVVAVGPRLVFPDGAIQHAGMVLGLGGIVGHYALGETVVPPLGPPDVPREVSCLTGACLLVRTADFERLGGLDETLAIDFQDVDLCLRLQRDLGGVLIYDPTHPLRHVQMASRDRRQAGNPETIERMRAKWGAELDRPDPYWSPHLSLVPPGGELADIPLRRRDRRRRVTPRVRGV